MQQSFVNQTELDPHIDTPPLSRTICTNLVALDVSLLTYGISVTVHTHSRVPVDPLPAPSMAKIVPPLEE